MPVRLGSDLAEASRAANNSSRGVWTLTPAGQQLLEADDGDSSGPDAVVALVHPKSVEHRRELSARKREPLVGGAEDDEASSDGSNSWNDELLAVLTKMNPASFERLSERPLRKAGFVSVTVTGRSGDGVNDGVGARRLSLLSFPVFFACQRYRGSLGSSSVRNVRGAEAGRGEKGLLITTGSYTADARQQSTGDGAPPIDLVDSDRLCELLKECRLGGTSRQVEQVQVD